MTPELLREAGEALYGSRWQTDLANDLGVALRTVQRWADGTRAIPDGLTDNIVELLEARGKTLVGLVGKIKRSVH